MALEDLLSKMYEEDVVIHNKDGYHYGKLCGYDGKFFYLERYCFGKKLMGYFEYFRHGFFGKEALVPAENIISISEMPLSTGDLLQDVADLRDFLTRYQKKDKAEETQTKEKPGLQFPLTYK